MPKLMPLLLLGKHSSGCVRVSSALLTLSWAVPLVPPTKLVLVALADWADAAGRVPAGRGHADRPA